MTSKSFSGVVATPKDSRRRKSYLIDEQRRFSFQRYSYGGCKVPAKTAARRHKFEIQTVAFEHEWSQSRLTGLRELRQSLKFIYQS